jgi:tetratricopeptide (TPR) repeat protein
MGKARNFHCSLECFKELLPHILAIWFERGQEWTEAVLTRIHFEALTPGSMAAGLGIAGVAAYFGLHRFGPGRSEEEEKLKLRAALNIIRSRSKDHEKELAALGYQLQYNFANVHKRLTGVDQALADLDAQLDGHFDALDQTLAAYFQTHRDRFDDLCFFLEINFEELRGYIAALPATVEELRRDREAVLGSLARIEATQADQPTKDDLQQMEQRLLAKLTRDAPPQSADASLGRDLIAAVERIASDAARGGMTARGVLASDRPGDVALYLSARRTQLDIAQHALNDRIDEEKLNLDREIAAVGYVTGRIDDAVDALNRILAQAPNDLDATNRLGHIQRLRGDFPAAERQYRRLLSIAPDDEQARATALGNLGTIAQTRGDLDAAEKLHRESLEISGKLRRLEGQASQLGNLGVIAKARGDLDAAEKLHRESLEIARKLGRLEGQAMQLSNLGVIAGIRGDLDPAEQLFREALEINRKLGRSEGQASQLGNLGNIALTRDDLDAAAKLYREALEINRKLGRAEGQATQLGNLGLIASRRGDLDAAEALLREALEINRKLGRLEGQATQLGNLGIIAQQRGNIAEARRIWTESRDLFARVGMPHMVKKAQGLLDGLPPG